MLHMTIIGELELPLLTMLLVSVAPYQLMNLRYVTNITHLPLFCKRLCKQRP